MKLSLVSIPVEDPVAAHEIYTSKLGFISKQFDAEAMIAIVVSPESPDGTAILLEPCKGTFAEEFKNSAYAGNLPIMIFKVPDAKAELARLKGEGIKLRPELDKPEWGMTNMFEDGCGNILMLEEGA